MKFALSTAVGAAGALCACTDYYPPPPPPGPPPMAAAAPLEDGCFRTRDIDNHRVADNHPLYVRVANRDVFRLEMSGSCLAGASSSDPIIMREPPGTAYACRP